MTVVMLKPTTSRCMEFNMLIISMINVPLVSARTKSTFLLGRFMGNICVISASEWLSSYQEGPGFESLYGVFLGSVYSFACCFYLSFSLCSAMYIHSRNFLRVFFPFHLENNLGPHLLIFRKKLHPYLFA